MKVLRIAIFHFTDCLSSYQSTFHTFLLVAPTISKILKHFVYASNYIQACNKTYHILKDSMNNFYYPLIFFEKTDTNPASVTTPNV